MTTLEKLKQVQEVLTYLLNDPESLPISHPRAGFADARDLAKEALDLFPSIFEGIENTNNCLKKWQEGFWDKPKHILQTDERLTDEQFSRLRYQILEQFGPGRAIILEGGVKYIGTTHTMVEANGF